MEKTKIGLTVPVTAALCYLMFALFGSTLGFLFLGLVLLCDSNVALKRSALSAAVIYIAFGLGYELLSLIPGGFDLIEELVRACDGSLNVSFIDKAWSLITSVYYYAQNIVFLILAWKAYKGKAVELSFVKKLVG